MLKRNSQILSVCFLVGDLAWTGVAWILAYIVRFEWQLFPLVSEPVDFSLCYRNLPLVLLLAAGAYHWTGQYVIQRFRSLGTEVANVCKGTALMGLLVIAATFGFHSPYESRLTMTLFLLLAGVLMLTWRRLSWQFIGWLRARGYNQKRALIVGTGRVARKTARTLRRAAWLGIKTVGFVEDQPTRWASDLDVVGGIDELPTLVKEYAAAHVFIALPLNRFDDARRVFAVLSESLVEIRLAADLPALGGMSLNTTHLHGLPIISLRENPHVGFNVLLKRSMDIALSLLALVVLAPLLLLVAAIVKLTSPGPVFYRQERCGLNGKPFQMLKFRSMRVDAETCTGAVWAQKDDPRRTPLGAFLRKTSLDELPQLLNVLRGDMSLVGPRPERPVFIQKFTKTIPNYNVRHAVKAGITGWAQVHGWRGNTSLRKRIQYDLFYICHWSLWLDIRIMFMTLWHGLFHRNAY